MEDKISSEVKKTCPCCGKLWVFRGVFGGICERCGAIFGMDIYEKDNDS